MNSFAIYKSEGDHIQVERVGDSVRIIAGSFHSQLTFSIEADRVHELIHKLKAVSVSEIERIKMERYLEGRDDKRKQSD